MMGGLACLYFGIGNLGAIPQYTTAASTDGGPETALIFPWWGSRSLTTVTILSSCWLWIGEGIFWGKGLSETGRPEPAKHYQAHHNTCLASLGRGGVQYLLIQHKTGHPFFDYEWIVWWLDNDGLGGLPCHWGRMRESWSGVFQVASHKFMNYR